MSDITATPAATQHFQTMLKKLNGHYGMRLSVKNSGCSGKRYILEPVIAPKDILTDDKIYPLAGDLKLYVDSESLKYLIGTEIDYVKKNLKGQIVFNNPTEKSHCGCGESFYV